MGLYHLATCMIDKISQEYVEHVGTIQCLKRFVRNVSKRTLVKMELSVGIVTQTPTHEGRIMRGLDSWIMNVPEHCIECEESEEDECICDEVQNEEPDWDWIRKENLEN